MMFLFRESSILKSEENALKSVPLTKLIIVVRNVDFGFVQNPTALYTFVPGL